MGSCLNMTLAQVFDLGPYLNCPRLYFLINKMGIMVFALRVDIRLRDDESTVVSAMLQNDSDYPTETAFVPSCLFSPWYLFSCPKQRLPTLPYSTLSPRLPYKHP